MLLYNKFIYYHKTITIFLTKKVEYDKMEKQFVILEGTMKSTKFANFNTMNAFVQDKIARYSTQEKNFATLFSHLFSKKENVLAEITDGYRIKKTTYGECVDAIYTLATVVQEKLADIPQGKIVGLCMNNSVEWIQIFWSLLMTGYNPLLINSRLDDGILENTLTTYDVAAVISDGKQFSLPTWNAQELCAAPRKDKYQPTVWGEEVLFMSSGTSNNVKLCAYTGENLFYQVCDTLDIITRCPQMQKHYEGELKHLAMLPFYHVFGFLAVYLWFSFLSCTFVFLKDLHPQTLLNTVKKHKVTHIFAVPLIWETVYKTAMQKIHAKGEKTERKFLKALDKVNKMEGMGSLIAKSAFKEVRGSLFGESVCFLISGGSGISQNALRFFNGIGYHIANGYGMTEVGITSLELSMKRKIRNQGAIGAPFASTQYSVSPNGELLIKSKTRATRILQNGEAQQSDFAEWFNSHDLAEKSKDEYYLQGRKDDLIVCKNGENINPELIEGRLHIFNANSVCLFADAEGVPTLLVSVANCFSSDNIHAVYEGAVAELDKLQLKDEVKNVVLTPDKLIIGSDFKKSRKKIATRYNEGRFTIIDHHDAEAYTQTALSELEKQLCACFAQVLGKESTEITPKADFFADLGGSSLDYFELIDVIKHQFNVQLTGTEEQKLSTVEEFYQYIKSNG